MKIALARFTRLFASLARRWRMCAGVLFAGVILFSFPSAGASSGGAFSLAGQPVGGGGRSVGGGFAITGMVLSPGGFNVGGPFALAGEILEVQAVPVGPFSIEISLTPAGQARLAWREAAAGFMLEASDSLGPDADWKTVPIPPGAASVLMEPAAPARYFRLREP